ncbi:MAG: V-type ATP synthase subunit A, partial [Candidatus Omnitrophota bacterium]
MNNKNFGTIILVHGNMVRVRFETDIIQNEVGYVLSRGEKLMAEVVRISGDIAYMQVFEDTKGVKIGDKVEFSGRMLSVQLGPGLLGQIYDGLQNPLAALAEKFGFFLPRGVQLDALDFNKKWYFKPMVKVKSKVTKGAYLGYVKEGLFKHFIMVPFNFNGEYEVEQIAVEGDYKIKDIIGRIKDERGRISDLSMVFEWPIKIPISAYI